MRRRPRLSNPVMLAGLLVLIGTACGVLAQAPEKGSDLPATLPRIPATAPDQTSRGFHLQHGFTLDLLAAEPLTTDPVAMAYDEQGRAWVVEMSDYPYTDKANDVAWQDSTKDLPIGKVRILEDTNGDGVFDRSTIFARDLSWPTGIALHKGGAYVAATPDVWYLKDTDGDGVADVREKVFTGFRKYNVQAVMNNLIWGLDNKIYGAGSSNGGTIQSIGQEGAKPVPLTRSDYLFDPVTRQFETTSGGARFGNAFDDWGNRFVCNIRNPIQHVVLPSRYLKRNPYLVAPSPMNDVAEAGDTLPVYRSSPPEPWRAIRAERWLKDGTVVPRSELSQGYFTSSSGVTVYRGWAYPPEFRNNVFVGEVAGNLIHRQKLTPVGPTFTSKRTEVDQEFMTSDDNWFRPVNFINAPDGTLHVLDMYRETIEHPWSIPDDIKALVDLESGRDRGRIYRLSPPGFTHKAILWPGSMGNVELVSLLAHPNSWQRETAQRLLVERQDPATVEPVRKLLKTSPIALGRLHALYTLKGLSALTDADILVALNDSEPGMRKHGLLLAESRLDANPELFNKALNLATDLDPVVRFQAAMTLGESRQPEVVMALESILILDADNPWIRTAVLSSLADAADQMLIRLLSVTRAEEPAALPLVRRQLASMTGARNKPEELTRVLNRITELSADEGISKGLVLGILSGLGDGLTRSRGNLRAAAKVAGPDVARTVDDLFKEAARIARNESVRETERLDAIELLAFEPYPTAFDVLSTLLNPRQPQAVQRAVLKTLSSFSEPRVTDDLLASWGLYTPALRSELVELLLARPARTEAVLAAIEAGQIPASQLTPTRRSLLLKHKDPKIAAKAATLFESEKVSPRREVIAAYQTALEQQGDAARGRLIFERECMTCHKAGERGHDVGPNMATIAHRTAGEVLTQILDPNREVGPNYVQYLVGTDDGRVSTGLIDNETANSLVLKRAEGVTETILRSNIETMTNSGQSLMPDGLEKKITPQEMADLLRFLLGPK